VPLLVRPLKKYPDYVPPAYRLRPTELSLNMALYSKFAVICNGPPAGAVLHQRELAPDLVALERVWNPKNAAHNDEDETGSLDGSGFGSIQYWKRKAATKKNWNSKVVDRFYRLYSNAR